MGDPYIQTREDAEVLYERSLPYIAKCLEYPFKTIVDFGCGFGLQLKEFAKAGKVAVGCDMAFDPEAVEFSEIGDQILLHPGPWTSMTGCVFDAGFSHHCLEHARDPILWLHQWGQALKPGALMFVVVPSYSEYLSAGHIAMGWDSAKLAYSMALAGFDCSRGRFEHEEYTVFGVAERPAEFHIAETSVLGWCDVADRMPFPLTIKSTIKPPKNIEGAGHDDLRCA